MKDRGHTMTLERTISIPIVMGPMGFIGYKGTTTPITNAGFLRHIIGMPGQVSV